MGKWKDQEERNIIRRAEKALLNKKIGEVAKKRKQLKEKGDQLRNDIKGALPDEMYAEIMKVNEERKRKEEEKSRRKQRDKYYRLKHGMKYSEYNAKYNIDKGEKEKKTPRDNGVDKSKWVINVSKRELTASERAILEKGAGFAIANKDIPYDDYVVATQEASRWLPKGQGLALNAEITEILNKARPSKMNITEPEMRSLKRLRKDESIVVLPADKGKALLVMDKEEYIRKMEEKLSDETTYKRIEKDPTQEIKQELVQQLKELKDEGIIDEKLHKELSPGACQIPRAYGSPKVHKEGYPLREIVDSTNSVAKNIDKYVSRIIKTYTIDNEHAIKNCKDFVEKIRSKTIREGMKMISFDVAALYPSVPQEEALTILEEHLKNDKELKKKTPIPVKKLMKLFRTCLKKTYFVFNLKLYLQVDGLAIGASSSVFLADVFMIRLERRALQTFINPPEIWFRYVDDTFTYLEIDQIQSFFEHLNNQHQKIKFTMEEEEEKKIPFLDAMVMLEEDGSITTKVYRKKTHTNQYLHYQSNHHPRQKIGTVSTLTKRMEIISKEEDRIEEEQTIRKAFKSCGYPDWVFKKKKKDQEKKKENESVGRISIPYVKGLSERIARTMKKHNIDAIHKPTSTIKNMLCSKAKDRLDPMDKPGAVYHIKCKNHGVDYIGETGRAAKVRMYDHRVITHDDSRRSHSLRQEKAEEIDEIIGERRSTRNVKRVDYKAMDSGKGQMLSIGNTLISEHMATTDHNDGDIEIKLIDFETNWKRRKLKETLAINRVQPTLKEKEGDYISPIFDSVPSKYNSGRTNALQCDVTDDKSYGMHNRRDDIRTTITDDV